MQCYCEGERRCAGYRFVIVEAQCRDVQNVVEELTIIRSPLIVGRRQQHDMSRSVPITVQCTGVGKALRVEVLIAPGKRCELYAGVLFCAFVVGFDGTDNRGYVCQMCRVHR